MKDPAVKISSPDPSLSSGIIPSIPSPAVTRKKGLVPQGFHAAMDKTRVRSHGHRYLWHKESVFSLGLAGGVCWGLGDVELRDGF